MTGQRHGFTGANGGLGKGQATRILRTESPQTHSGRDAPLVIRDQSQADQAESLDQHAQQRLPTTSRGGSVKRRVRPGTTREPGPSMRSTGQEGLGVSGTPPWQHFTTGIQRYWSMDVVYLQRHLRAICSKTQRTWTNFLK